MKAMLAALPSGIQLYLEKDKVVIGRNDDNDIINSDSRVSRAHCAIIKKGRGYFIEDLDSSNGTFINGKKIDKTVKLRNNDTISLGQQTAAYQFRRSILSFGKALDTLKKPKVIIPGIGAFLVIALLLGYIFIFRNIGHIDVQKELRKLESVYGENIAPRDADSISALEKSIELVRQEDSFNKTLELRKQYKELIEGILKKNKLLPDYSFIVWAESRYDPLAYNSFSQAAGMWQLVPATARQYGLLVNSTIDERIDPVKSTNAAALYLADLVSILGKDSFLLVLAAYNAGDNVVLFGLKQIQDPNNDRNFWYLYKNNLIPEETKQYVLKILALIIIVGAS